MKKLILFMIIFSNFIIFSEQKNDNIYENKKYSTVLKIENDDYDNAIGIETSSKENLKGFQTVLIGGSISLDIDINNIYKNISKDANKVTLIYFDDKDTDTIKKVIEKLKKKKFKGQVEIISFLSKERKSLKKNLEKKGWNYSNYNSIDEISELVSYDGLKKSKSEIIEIFLEKIKKSLENNEENVNRYYKKK